ncbi:hypothetical protein GCM10007301_33800 [Azorhizobium oxalatiphilum]|uniref:SnoaL-like domain-containing protein n=1 Tax=Azorhizobium oxalatiphilum TaxID=980631 RepID=A0A917FED1_9HYPH|nr:nuclear transport factor 2 family protein [Azorhizobium oxalatiphilum]GGF71301.1 hypothetical protein GCM10007301_33800 [Azorhizobium oxalatiphilum]
MSSGVSVDAIHEVKTIMNATDTEHAAFLLRANIERVLNERDEARRLKALSELWADDAVMFEADEVFSGQKAISDNVGALLARLPAGTLFRPASAPVVNHEAALLRWTAGSDPAKPAVTGTDLAFIENGRIRKLYVFLDPRNT